MKATNNKAVRIGYIRFSGYLATTVALTVGIVFFFMKTSSIEVKNILDKTKEYDEIYMKQLALTASMDSIYQYTSLLNTSPKINDLLLQSIISNKKMTMQDRLHSMDAKDCLLFRKIINDLNRFLSIKDSIRIIAIQEELTRNDLLRCVEENKQASRKLSAGGLTFEKK